MACLCVSEYDLLWSSVGVWAFRQEVGQRGTEGATVRAGRGKGVQGSTAQPQTSKASATSRRQSQYAFVGSARTCDSIIRPTTERRSIIPCFQSDVVPVRGILSRWH
jgi:hypothetical protein